MSAAVGIAVALLGAAVVAAGAANGLAGASPLRLTLLDMAVGAGALAGGEWMAATS